MSREHLLEALEQHMRRQNVHGLYSLSMDHSPSEQLTGETWHTTVLIMSSHMQHEMLAVRLARRLRHKTGILMKWTNASKKYRDCFLSVFFEELNVSPAVSVFAISAKEGEIRDSAEHFIRELGLQQHYNRVETLAGKIRVEIGPLMNVTKGEKVTISLSENRALMGLFIAHFVIRMQSCMYEAAKNINQVSMINLNFLGDKFPGPPGQEMDLMFQALTSFSRATGRIAWGYFGESDTEQMDLLADNLAGALNAMHRKQGDFPGFNSDKMDSGLFYWEVWSA
ncbi:hypothetical protein DXT88_08915 [Herbaspirillum lusitanum]|uniref:hypothetical protein n=1 Tax=Herbaspirillum lusitanum TaxID=213312 RepID=UPI002237B050|nr:hypothetical protein [Herbaspirillum lusitanum]MCW5298295.1 hypothetical protein [Herbaspirillum lusitanum]